MLSTCASWLLAPCVCVRTLCMRTFGIWWSIRLSIAMRGFEDCISMECLFRQLLLWNLYHLGLPSPMLDRIPPYGWCVASMFNIAWACVGCVCNIWSHPTLSILLFDTKEGYGLLATKTKGLGICLFRVKPKLHLQEHFPFPGFRFRNYFCYFFRRPPS